MKTGKIIPPLVALALVAWPSLAAAQDFGQAGQFFQFLRPGGVVVAGIAILIAVITLRILSRFTERFSSRFADRRLLAQQVNTVARFAIYVITIAVVVTSVVSLEREAILALSGALAVALGFALKDLASAIIAGLIILFDRPFQVGDRVTVAGQYGEITTIGLRSVRLVTLDDSVVTIPNNRFLTEVVSSGNAGALDMQIVIDFHIAPDADIDKAKRIVDEAVKTSRFVYLRKPVVVLVNEVVQANYFATRLRAKAYVLDIKYEKAFESDVTERVKLAFKAANVRPPEIILGQRVA